MENFLERAKLESAELRERIHELMKFIGSEKFLDLSDENRFLLLW